MDISITLDTLPESSPVQLAALPVEQLATLMDEADAHLRRAQAIKRSLDEAVAHRYDNRTSLVRNQNQKPTGIVRFDDGPFVVIADLPKKPEWDQERLATIVGQIRESGENPMDYVEVSYRVPESRYNAWPTSIRKYFEPARTLKVGRPTFKLERPTSRGGR
ncbi:MAG: hypothetical protein HQL73_10515 [Magnetococcales bacterium]|nr:hypothetical protein [Magnetococcales bacterium]